MTLQQLQYIVALDEYRHFVRAAEACKVTQSTLSSMIKSLENELDAVIFDRKAHPVKPTEIGEKIISKARVVLFNAGQLAELANEERAAGTGHIAMGIIPTVSPYILPGMVSALKRYPGLSVKFSEAGTDVLAASLKKAELDVAIMASGVGVDSDLLEIPLYHEKFLAYVTPGDPLFVKEVLEPADLPGEDLWVLREGHCFRNQISGFCDLARNHSALYESGSIDTLLRVLDANGGHTIIPQMHLDFLTDVQRLNIREIRMSGNPSLHPVIADAAGEPVREIVLVIRHDYVRERFLNIIADIVKSVVPEQMLDLNLRRFPIRL